MDPARYSAQKRVEVAAVQHPFASVLTCADSQTPPEAIFGQGLGDLFVVRVAGAVSTPGVIASLEYAADKLGSEAIVVMGHTSCGIVKDALDRKNEPRPVQGPVDSMNLMNLLRPALERPQQRADPWTSAVYASVEQTIGDLVEQSVMLRERAQKGQILLLGAIYQSDSGKVVFSKPIAISGGSK